MNVAYIAIYLILIMALGGVGVFALRRKSKAKVAVIRDLRNPSAPEKKFYFYPNSKAGYIALYSNLITPFSSGITPPTDLRPYIYWDKRLYGYVGVSGKAEDDNIVLLRRPMVGQVEAQLQAQSLADAIQKTLGFYEVCNNYRINDEVEFLDVESEEDENEKYQGRIVDMGYEGIVIEAETWLDRTVEVIEDGRKVKEKRREKKTHTFTLTSAEAVAEAKLKVIKAAGKSVALSAGIDRFFNEKWVSVNLGIVPVDDVNVMLRSQKEFIAEFNSKVNDRVLARQSWLERNMVLVSVVLVVVGLSIAFAIMAYATQQYVTGTIGHTSSALNSLAQKIINSTRLPT